MQIFKKSYQKQKEKKKKKNLKQTASKQGLKLLGIF